MKKLGKAGILIIIAILLVLWGIAKYNGLISLKQEVEKSWSNVENQYQRRADLIPNLVNTVKGYASHESETLQAVVEARNKATQTQVNVDSNGELSEESLKNFQKAQSELSGALSRLIAISEAYPDLKADGLFQDLQAQLEGTENRIVVARNDFNTSAKNYNTQRLKFPTNIVASIFGFGEKAYFQAEEGSERAPQVSFE